MELPAVTPNLAFEDGISNFSFSLYGAFERDGNEFISPYSISAALLLFSLGTDGTTKHQFMSAMFGDADFQDVHLNYNKLNTKLFGRTEKGIALSFGNRLFASKTITFLDSFISKALKYYGSDILRLDFATQTEKSRKTINDWIAKQTNNRIRDMIPRGVLNSYTKMVLANAIYFKGTWKTKFEPKETKKRNFFVNSNNQMQVDMMYKRLHVKSGEYPQLNCKVLQLPYVGDKLSMVFILPNDGDGLLQLESKLTFYTFNNLLTKIRKQDTIVRIPKFSIKASYDLKPIFIKLGISEIFDSSIINLSNMIPGNRTSNEVFVSDARHKTFLEVTEEGSEAAAATTLTFGITSSLNAKKPPPFQFVADHPFVFAIIDNLSKTILFIGRFVGP